MMSNNQKKNSIFHDDNRNDTFWRFIPGPNHEADINSMNSCRLIPTHYEKQQIITSRADERVEGEGCEMSYE